MKTIIFDIDGTITDMWPIERSVLLYLLDKDKISQIENLYRAGLKDTYKIFCAVSRKKVGKVNYQRMYNKSFFLLERRKTLPKVKSYPIVRWIKMNKDRYHFVFVTGGQEKETLYVLRYLSLDSIFDFSGSLSKSNYRFSKITGLPFKKVKSQFSDCFLVTDSENDCRGARLAGVKYVKVIPRQSDFTRLAAQ